MSSLNFGEAWEFDSTEEFFSWLSAWDWAKRYCVLSIGDRTGIPDLDAVEMDGTLMPGETVRKLISLCEPENIEAINWGNDIWGLCLYDTQALHYIVREPAQDLGETK